VTSPDGVPAPPARRRRERKAVLLRLDPELHDALARWAADDLRSTNGHIEWLLRQAVVAAGRSPGALPATGRDAENGSGDGVAADG
jgi:hypothetical protein